MQRKRNEDGGLARGGPAVLQRNRTVHSENRPTRNENRLARNEDRRVHNESRPARNENHHNIQRFSPKSKFSSNVVMIWKSRPPQRCLSPLW